MKMNLFNTRKKVFNLVIVDESGSMSTIHHQAFSGMNETLSSVRAMQLRYPETDQRITLVTFNSSHTTCLLDNVPALDTRELPSSAYNPSGCTPLYDAIGRAVTKLEAQVEACDARANVLVTIITDGEENSSREWRLSMIRALIERLKSKGWTFALIGTDNLDVQSMAAEMSIDEHLKFCQDAEGTDEMFRRERRARERFVECTCCNTIMPSGHLFDEG